MAKPEFKPYPKIDTVQIELSDEKKEKLSAWIDKKKEAIYFDRAEFVERQERYFSNFDDFVSFTRKGPWDESSNVHLPLTEIILKAYYSRLYNIFTSHDITKLVPRNTTLDEQFVKAVSKLRSWYMYDYINHHRGVKPVLREVLYDTTSVGYGVIMKAWDIKQRKTFDLVRNEFNEEMADLEGQMASMEAQELEEGEAKLDISEYKEVAKIVTSFEGTKLFTVPFEDIYFPNLIHGSSDLNQPRCVIVSAKSVAPELKLKAEQGLYDKEVVDESRLKGTRLSDRAYSMESSIKDVRDRLSGYESQYSHYDEEERDIEYCFCTYDIDDDGFAEEIVVTRLADSDILNVNYLDRTSRLGRRPLYKFDCFTKSRQSYSRGVPEFMYQLQEAIDMNFNMRMDNLQLQTLPWGVVNSASALNNAPMKMQPGQWIPVDDVNNSIRPLSFPVNASALGIEEQRLWQYAERLAVVPPHSSGTIGENVGPLRSTSGLSSLLQQINKEFQPMVEHNADTWRELELGLLEDLEFRVDTNLKMRVLGPDLEEEISPVEFRDAFRLTAMLDMKIDVASVIHSEEFRRNDANVLFQLFSSPSLLQQFGIVTPRGLYKFARDVLKEYGKDYEDYLDKPEFIDKALTTWQEIQICAQLEVPPMSPTDNHELKAEELMQFMESPEFAEAMNSQAYPQEMVSVVMQAVNKHRELAAIMAQQQQANPLGVAPGMGSEMNAMASGNAPQQGGQNPQMTTGRAAAQGQGENQQDRESKSDK